MNRERFPSIPVPGLRFLLVLFILTGAGCTTEPSDPFQEAMGASDIEWVHIEEGTNHAVSLSPDGTQLAMALQGRLWGLPVEGGDAEPWTGPGLDVLEPDWSPDGEKVVFYSYVDHYFQLMLFDVKMGKTVALTRAKFDHREPSWSPDGEWIYFVTDRSGPYDMWRISAEGGDPEPVLESTSDLGYPVLSPDGESLAYVDFSGGGSVVVRSEEGEVLRSDPGGRPVAPSWSPDGSKIHVTYYRRGISESAILNLSTGAWTRLDRGGQDLFPFRASWLSNEELIVTADGKIQNVDLTEGVHSDIPFRALFAIPGSRELSRMPERVRDRMEEQTVRGIVSPEISPDGQSIAFAALGDIWVQDRTGDPRQVTQTPWVELDPDWSPDGRKLAYASDQHGAMQLHVHDLETGDTHRVAPELERISSPAWSWSGEWIALLVHTRLNGWGGATLYRVHVESGEAEALHPPLFSPGEPAWTPDDQAIGLLALDRQNGRYREGTNRIRMIPMDGRDPFFASPTGDETLGMRSGSGPAWSGRSDHTVAFIYKGGLWKSRVEPDGTVGSDPVRLSDALASSPSWSRDGETLLVLSSGRFRWLTADGQQIAETEPAWVWQPEIGQGRRVVRAGRLFNGVDHGYQRNVDIVIEGDRIVRVEPARPGREEPVLDASDFVVMPGLFDMHTHQHSMEGERLGRQWLSYGITSVREPGSDPYDGLERKESWSSGTRPGPRLFTTGGLMDGTRVYYGLANPVFDSVQLEKELDRARDLTFDLMKSYVRFPDSLQQKLSRGVNELGIPLSSHELYPAVWFGAESVEHLRGTSRRGYSLKQSARNRSYQDVVSLLARSGMSVTPTVVMHGGYWLMAGKYPELLDHPQLNSLWAKSEIDDLRERAAASGYGRRFGDEGETEPGAIQDAIVRIADAGGVVTAGTDAPFVPFGSSLHAELWLYVDAGMTPEEALQSATIHAARASGVGDKLGSIEANKWADLVVVDGDPLSNIRDALNVRGVMKGGIWMPADSLFEGKYGVPEP
ncbi:MAG: amidohydrolase family protein [Balneolaceae bacterium]